jgi:hypothetical protein
VLTDEIATLTGTTIEELANGMVDVLTSPDTARRKAAIGRQWYQSRYSRNVYTSKMQRLFELVA